MLNLPVYCNLLFYRNLIQADQPETAENYRNRVLMREICVWLVFLSDIAVLKLICLGFSVEGSRVG